MVYYLGDPNNYRNSEGCVAILVFPTLFGGLVDLASIHSFPTVCEDPRYQDEQEKQNTMAPARKLR
ncbi:UNVERIFIED_CONTAM: hypothetical protein B566_EDAN018006 [Ephemera danica]|nr:hypothetical protein B566_EDAN018006 [Ephemera danica]